MMRAMILAAGRGERMRPFTDHTPKPLLCVGGKPLIVWHIERLAAAGFADIVVNLAWLGEHIQAALGDGAHYGVRLHYSHEARALETAGGIAHALPLLGAAPFLVINGDIWCDWDAHAAHTAAQALRQQHWLACLWLVDNPAHHLAGDFVLRADGRGHEAHTLWHPCAAFSPARERGSEPSFTFSGIGVYHPALFAHIRPGEPAKLAPLLRQAMRAQRVGGTHHRGAWVDVGTPARLRTLDAQLGRVPPTQETSA